MAVNLRAPALLSRAFAAALPDTLDDPALVVNLLDAKLGSLNPDYFTYTLSKIGFEGLTELFGIQNKFKDGVTRYVVCVADQNIDRS